jgi:hypothetical protein
MAATLFQVASRVRSEAFRMKCLSLKWLKCVPLGGVARLEQAAREAVASERLGAAIGGSPLGSGCDLQTQPRNPDDRQDDGPSRAGGEGP